ncbi:hypothetical protein [Thalassospira sp. ER-Se-21-Dark]|uniref:hypothetical protein n=1 Tax=Thalassospira sp. ER-Se-21-Dark TaxID=2585190 RepID=UPI001B301678|nr:hypothetical protein [Thalassospira sp. ER-Se-21-Dark]MBP3127968.1 hypothetical protein [Thalassospira sp. ER-Se-21-Dark]
MLKLKPNFLYIISTLTFCSMLTNTASAQQYLFRYKSNGLIHVKNESVLVSESTEPEAPLSHCEEFTCESAGVVSNSNKPHAYRFDTAGTYEVVDYIPGIDSIYIPSGSTLDYDLDGNVIINLPSGIITLHGVSGTYDLTNLNYY